MESLSLEGNFKERLECHSLVDKVPLGHSLDSIISKVFSNLVNSVIFVFGFWFGFFFLFFLFFPWGTCPLYSYKKTPWIGILE